MKQAGIFLFTLWMAVTSSARGFDTGNAGDAFAAEFLFSGRDVLQRLELLSRTTAVPVDLLRLREAMEETVIVTEDRVFLDGHERDAINFPSRKLIKLNRARWNELRRSSETRARLTLVLHEYLWIAGVDDTNFKKALPLIELINVAPYSPSLWLQVPGLAFSTVECMGISQEGLAVTVQIQTQGVTKTPYSAEVQITQGSNVFGYRFGANEIAQFFEFDDAERNWATVGLGAFVDRAHPVIIKYDGPNFVDQDLATVIASQMATGERNFMRVWKGPGSQSEEVYKVERVACSVSSNN